MVSCRYVSWVAAVSAAGAVVTAGILGYIALQVLVMMYSIKAIIAGPSGCESVGAYRWIWFICVWTGLTCYGMFINRDKITAIYKPDHIPWFLATVVAWGLWFGLVTLLRFRGECSGVEADQALLVYGCGSVAMSGTILVTCILYKVIDDVYGEDADPPAVEVRVVEAAHPYGAPYVRGGDDKSAGG